MALITRITRLFKADMHAVLDSMEDPLSVLKQAVRDMSDEIERGEKQLEDIGRRSERHRRYIDDQERHLRDTQQQIDLCFRANNEKLARTMVRRSLELQKRIKLAEREQDALHIEQARLTKLVADQKDKLTSIRERMEIFAEDTQHRSSAQEESKGFNDYVVSEDEVEIAFLAERERRTGSASEKNGVKEGTP